LSQWHSMAQGAQFAGACVMPLLVALGQRGSYGLRRRIVKASLVSVIDDDRFFRESIKRLMRSLGYSVEAFPSAADFLASPRLVETACLVADIHMPAMTGLDLYRHLIAAGYTIPTILVTAYPDDVDRARALKDGVVCYLRKPVDEKHLMRCLQEVFHSGEPTQEKS
jgi:FixJ family two-component response regulator